MIFKDTFEDLTPERLGEIIDAFEAGKGATVTPGPQNGRVYSAPITGLTTLKDETPLLKATREREARAATKEAKAAGAEVPPSKAAKPKTYAAETNGTLKSPSPVKSSPKTEKATSATAPMADPVAANKAEPAVEKATKQRKAPIAKAEPAAAFKSPELLRGEPIGAEGKQVDAAPARAASKPSLDDKNRPAGIEKPAAVDDLKLISGVGPKIEGTLHSLGIYTFRQIAAWKKAEREWVDGYLNFRGRIERDDWVSQAKALAKGGVAEYIRVFGKKPV
jgi:NADH-quinone oxidoreductase subunit E